MHEGGARVVKPPQRVERHIPGAADQHEPAQPVGAVKPPGAALATEPVIDGQVPVLDPDLESVAVRDGDAAASAAVGLAMQAPML